MLVGVCVIDLSHHHSSNQTYYKISVILLFGTIWYIAKCCACCTSLHRYLRVDCCFTKDVKPDRITLTRPIHTNDNYITQLHTKHKRLNTEELLFRQVDTTRTHVLRRRSTHKEIQGNWGLVPSMFSY